MKIVQWFSFLNLYPIIVAENVKDPYGKVIVDFLNENAAGSSIKFCSYKLVPDDYKLMKSKR